MKVHAAALAALMVAFVLVARAAAAPARLDPRELVVKPELDDDAKPSGKNGLKAFKGQPVTIEQLRASGARPVNMQQPILDGGKKPAYVLGEDERNCREGSQCGDLDERFAVSPVIVDDIEKAAQEVFDQHKCDCPKDATDCPCHSEKDEAESAEKQNEKNEEENEKREEAKAKGKGKGKGKGGDGDDEEGEEGEDGEEQAKAKGKTKEEEMEEQEARKEADKEAEAQALEEGRAVADEVDRLPSNCACSHPQPEQAHSCGCGGGGDEKVEAEEVGAEEASKEGEEAMDKELDALDEDQKRLRAEVLKTRDALADVSAKDKGAPRVVDIEHPGEEPLELDEDSGELPRDDDAIATAEDLRKYLSPKNKQEKKEAEEDLLLD